jgi:hypothetical protein
MVKDWRLTNHGFEIFTNKRDGWLFFAFTKHPVERARRRNISEQSIALTVKSVNHLLNMTIQNRVDRPEIVIPNYCHGVAVLLALQPMGGKVITVLQYPFMALPKDIPVLDYRACDSQS